MIKVGKMSNYDFGSSVSGIRFRSVNDDELCSACREIDGVVFPREGAPTLPYEKCTSELGCRCWAAPVVDLEAVRRERLKRLGLDPEPEEERSKSFWDRIRGR